MGDQIHQQLLLIQSLQFERPIKNKSNNCKKALAYKPWRDYVYTTSLSPSFSEHLLLATVWYHAVPRVASRLQTKRAELSLLKCFHVFYHVFKLQ